MTNVAQRKRNSDVATLDPREKRAQHTPEIEREFKQLVKAWKVATRTSSSSVAMAMHPAYQRIIGLGSPAIPLILRELQHETGHWFWALKAITGSDPVPPGSRGKLREMAEAWLRWGNEEGYVW